MRFRLMAMALATALLSPFAASAQALDPEPANPPPFPPPPTARTVRLATNRTVLRPPVRPGTNANPFANPSTRVLPAGAVPAQPVPSKPDALKFDAREKTVDVKAGETEAKFTFAVTNVSAEEVTIVSVHTSCGCTAARLPSTPWVLKPGEGGEVGATMNVQGKFGTVTKTVTVVSTAGTFPLFVKSVLPKDAYEQMQRMGDRSRNLQIAAADRQVVFRGDCARCHVEPGVGKLGKDLYVASCGVCHDAEHRATMVPALRGRPGVYGAEYWSQWIRNGKEGSLMPAFDLKKGGPLTEEQITSLAAYLAGDFTREPATATPPSKPLDARPAGTPGATPVAPAAPVQPAVK